MLNSKFRKICQPFSEDRAPCQLSNNNVQNEPKENDSEPLQ